MTDQHTDASGNVTRRERMTAWGEPADGTWTNGPGYTGHQMDAGSKLVYMQQRYYDPATGRFLSVDPVASDPATGWNQNRYNYAANNAYKFTDPDGRVVRRPGDSMPKPGSKECMSNPGCAFALAEGSESNVEKRKAMDKAAQAAVGSTDWARAKAKEPFPANTDKCNLFPSDIANGAGATLPRYAKPDGTRPLHQAGQLLDRALEIENWRVLGPGERPMPGDIAAFPTPGTTTTTGHAGMIVSCPACPDGISSVGTTDYEIVLDDGMFEGGDTTVYRRYTGD